MLGGRSRISKAQNASHLEAGEAFDRLAETLPARGLRPRPNERLRRSKLPLSSAHCDHIRRQMPLDRRLVLGRLARTYRSFNFVISGTTLIRARRQI